MSQDYKTTVFLPKTVFSMKANLSQREPEILARWEAMDIYKKQREFSKDLPRFTLHDGPPYANGHLHNGHALNKLLKDLVLKTRYMMGYDTPYVPGWDCHGLPIEWKIEESYRAKGLNKDEVPLLEFRQECRQFAAKWIDIQREEFKRLGVFAEWDHPYATMDFDSEADIMEQLCEFIMNGGLYRGLKPVMWSVVEQTSLAEAEIEYKDHTSDSIYVSFPVIKASHPLLDNAHAVIWTTTPWTLPGNRAIAYGPEFEYEIIDVPSLNKKLVIAKDLLHHVAKSLDLTDYSLMGSLKGDSLEGTICAHPLRGKGYDFDVPMLPGDHVTTEAGTGLVHTAPGHGLEDFNLGKAFNIEVPETVGPDGRYYDKVPLFAGEHVYKANPKVMAALEGHLLGASKIVHSYPHSWRSKAPLIFRTTTQLFISMDKNDLRKKAMAAIDQVQWIPQQGRNRIAAMVENRPDWCLSRQRAWGTPIPVFVHKESGEIMRDADVNKRIIDAVREEGGDTWFSSPATRFLGEKYNPNDYEQVKDIADVWFDSGCTQYFTLQKRADQMWPADLYLEGSDQHRGWFQLSLLVSCGTNGQAPFKTVLTHGFVLDESGNKMSKSQGNVVVPAEVIDTMGADILRLWVASSDYGDDLRIGKEILKQLEDIYRRYRNTLRYLLGALDGYSESETLPESEMPLLEKWVLHRLAELEQLRDSAFKDYDFLAFYNELHTFCAVDLSAFYFDIRKDCLYCDAPSNPKRQATRTVMDRVLNYLIHWLAPVLSFTAEEAYSAYPRKTSESIHLNRFPSVPQEWLNPEDANKLERLRDIRRVMTGALEVERAAKTIGSSLQAEVTLYVPLDVAEFLKAYDVAELGITSTVNIVVAQPPASAFVLEEYTNIGVVVNPAKGQKCGRCWKILEEVGQNEQASDLCGRCAKALGH